jgi:hypothetical protein
MNLRLTQFFILIVFCCLSMAALGQNVCPARPSPGSTIRDPEILQSQNGTLTVNFTMYNSPSQTGAEEYCYVYSDGTEAPTLLLNPGDTLIVNLTNRLTAISGARHMSHGVSAGMPGDLCAGGETNSATTNIHFHRSVIRMMSSRRWSSRTTPRFSIGFRYRQMTLPACTGTIRTPMDSQ